MMKDQKKRLKDPKKIAQFGFEQGIGFIPFAGGGMGVFKAVTKDAAAPVRAAAAKILAKDPDAKSGEGPGRSILRPLLDRARGGPGCTVAAEIRVHRRVSIRN